MLHEALACRKAQLRASLVWGVWCSVYAARVLWPARSACLPVASLPLGWPADIVGLRLFV
jgi:hypothetical protein